jgi:hypothetical protein
MWAAEGPILDRTGARWGRDGAAAATGSEGGWLDGDRRRLWVLTQNAPLEEEAATLLQ